MLATIMNNEDATEVMALFKRWQPLIAVIAMPSSSSRRERASWAKAGGPGTLNKQYIRRDIDCTHSDIGGVTTASWHFVHYSRDEVIGPTQAVMMAPDFPRPLQSALHDTFGGYKKGRKLVFEKTATTAPLSGPNVIGYASIVNQMHRVPVYDASGLAPDISRLSGEEKYVWVRANSVYGSKQDSKKVLRAVDITELFAIWDYEGKAESQYWAKDFKSLVLRRRLQSPPAKMLRSFAFTAGETLLPHTNPVPPPALSLFPGKASDVPFSPMEEAVSTRVKAAQADDAEVDLSQWAEPGETEEVANARAVLRRFSVRWWAKHQEKIARRWLKNLGPDAVKEDIEGINDCLRRTEGCTYWSWNRGSRLFFWKLPAEWRKDFRDGVPFWKVSTPPKGYMRNMPAPSREAELLTRQGPAARSAR